MEVLDKSDFIHIFVGEQYFMPDQPNQKKIRICKTFGEFEAIELRLSEEGKGDLKTYLRGQIRKLIKVYNSCPNCITAAYGEKIHNSYYLDSIKTFQTLQEISFIMQKPVSSIVDDFIIAPLLVPDLDIE